MLPEVPAHPSLSGRPAKTSSHSAVLSSSLKVASKRESCVVKKAKLPLNHQLKASASLKQAFDSYLGVTRHMLTLTNLVDVVRVGSENIHFLPVAGTTMYSPAVLLWQGGHRAKHPAMQPAKLWRQEATAVPSHGDAPCVCVWREEESAGETPGIYKWVRHHQRGFHVQSIWKGDIFCSSSLIRGM